MGLDRIGFLLFLPRSRLPFYSYVDSFLNIAFGFLIDWFYFHRLLFLPFYFPLLSHCSYHSRLPCCLYSIHLPFGLSHHTSSLSLLPRIDSLLCSCSIFLRSFLLPFAPPLHLRSLVFYFLRSFHFLLLLLSLLLFLLLPLLLYSLRFLRFLRRFHRDSFPRLLLLVLLGFYPLNSRHFADHRHSLRRRIGLHLLYRCFLFHSHWLIARHALGWILNCLLLPRPF